MRNEELAQTHERLLDSVHETAVTVGRVTSEFNSRSHLAHAACHAVAFIDNLNLNDLEEITRPELIKNAEIWHVGGIAFDSLNFILQRFDYQRPTRRMKHINYWNWNREDSILEPEYGYERFGR